MNKLKLIGLSIASMLLATSAYSATPTLTMANGSKLNIKGDITPEYNITLKAGSIATIDNGKTLTNNKTITIQTIGGQEGSYTGIFTGEGKIVQKDEGTITYPEGTKVYLDDKTGEITPHKIFPIWIKKGNYYIKDHKCTGNYDLANGKPELDNHLKELAIENVEVTWRFVDTTSLSNGGEPEAEDLGVTEDGKLNVKMPDDELTINATLPDTLKTIEVTENHLLKNPALTIESNLQHITDLTYDGGEIIFNTQASIPGAKPDPAEDPKLIGNTKRNVSAKTVTFKEMTEAGSAKVTPGLTVHGSDTITISEPLTLAHGSAIVLGSF